MKKSAFIFTLVVGQGLALAAAVVKCTDLPAAPFGSEVKVESATIVPASSALPEHCDVRGAVWPEARFAVKLPTEWNHRFAMVGNGGTAGTITLEAMESPLRKGFATASTDTGHDAAKEPMTTFAQPGPTNPNARRKAIDFAYQSVHETALLAKNIIKAYYGESPRHSYWVGCSTGGRQGLMEAQRFPEDFDGLVIGAPVLNVTGTTMRLIWNGVAQLGPGAIAAEKLPLLANAIYKKCDSLDGLEDGLIDDPRKCAFNPARDLPKCPAGTDSPDCFTEAQAEALKKIYGGVKTSAGRLIFPGQPPGAEVLNGWRDTITGPRNGALLRAESSMRFMYMDPAPGPSWEFQSFNFDTDPPRMAVPAATFNAANPDLRTLKQRGGKILHYHGWADPLVTPLMSIDYFDSVVKEMGGKETREFYRLFLVPGMFHCSGGVGCSTVDWLAPVVDWVEKGTPPDKLTGAHLEGAQATRTRPLCVYPKVARYKGSGSIDAAENFVCVDPT